MHGAKPLRRLLHFHCRRLAANEGVRCPLGSEWSFPEIASGMISIKQGVDLPVSGDPAQSIEDGPSISKVALVADDYVGMKPTMQVDEGDSIALGQCLFTDKKTPGVRFTSPAAGKVLAINRGDKRIFQSIEIELEGDAEVTFASYENSDLTTLTRDQVRENLLNSGLWTAVRTRPYSKVPPPDSTPHSIFVTAVDTEPLAADPALIVRENETAFIHGLQVLKHLTDGQLFVCCRPDARLPGHDLSIAEFVEFRGPHPAGLPGTHIHFLDPVSDKKTVWYLDCQDVIAIGKLFTTGKLTVDRVISLAGPSVTRPRLIRTRLGANTDELTEGQLDGTEHRVISGSVLSGRNAVAPRHYLGRYHRQVSVLAESREREFLSWLGPGGQKFSIKRVFASGFVPTTKPVDFTTSTEGSRRAMVPIGMYEKVMPLDMEPTFLLRSLIVGDTEQAQALGCLELDEEDLALCTFVCPGKYEYGRILRENLQRIEKEG